MGLFTRIFGTQQEYEIQKAVNEVFEGKLRETIKAIQDTEILTQTVTSLREEIARQNAEIARKELDLEHKLGLERMRQESEAALAKDRITVEAEKARLEARKEASKEARADMEDFLDRQEKLIGVLVEALPSAKMLMKVDG